jgi:hypothetical protein
MAKGRPDLSQGWVRCEDHLLCYKGCSCSLSLLLSMMSSNNRSDQTENLAVVVVEVVSRFLRTWLVRGKGVFNGPRACLTPICHIC